MYCAFADEKRADLIGFTATLTEDKDIPGGGTIVFDDVTINYGNGYDATTGEFTCPINGLYFILFNIFTSADNDWATSIHIEDGNGSRDMSGIRNLGAHTINSTTGNLVYCIAGGKIKIVNRHSNTRKARSEDGGVRQSVFTGFLLVFDA